MSLKDLFDKKTKVVVNNDSLAVTGTLFESADHINALSKNQVKYISNVNFGEPKNFARFGSAEMYYEDSIKNIYRTYPYDGTATEKKEWENNLTDVETYIFNYEYPKTAGHIIFGTSFGSITAITASDSTIYSTTPAPQYIKIRPSSVYSTTDLTSLYNIASKNKSIPLNLYTSGGLTIEFWMKVGEKQVSPYSSILDLWNSSSISSSNYQRILIEHVSSSQNAIKLTILSGTSGASRVDLFNTSSFTLTNWNHYAISFVPTGSQLNVKAYINGNLSSYLITGSSVGDFNSLIGNIGSYIYSPSVQAFSSSVFEGYGVISASFDEFRFWKYQRNANDIGRNWFVNVDGTNNPVADLGFYYKFNEGIIDTASVATSDSKIIDYSGRLLDGTYINYAVNARSTASAIVLSGLTEEIEPLEPIIRTSNPILSDYLVDKVVSGTLYDEENNKTIYKSLPSWLAEEEEEFSTKHLKQVSQIIASYFDNLYNKVQDISEARAVSYNSGNVEPLPFYNRALDAYGFKVSDLFVNYDVVEQLLSRTDEEVFDDKLQRIKNLIYQNIFNNLSYIYKSKGTEKSFRNLLRSYGVDEELVKFNLYADNAEYTFTDTYTETSTKKKIIDFSKNFNSSIYQKNRSSVGTSLSYIPSIPSDSFNLHYLTPYTFEGEFIFQKKPTETEDSYVYTDFVTSSLFGAHTANSSNQNDYTWYSSDVFNFQVYFVKNAKNNPSGYFKLVSSGFGKSIELTSSIYTDVYDDNKWNFAVKIVPQIGTNINLLENSSLFNNLTASLEFYGINTISGRTINQFSLSSSLTGASLINALLSPKRIYVGAHVQNFTGSNILQYSDVKAVSARVWADNLADEEIKFHSQDVKNYGRKSIFENPYLGIYKNVKKIDTLLLDWNFDTITGSDSNGNFDVISAVSSSKAQIPVLSTIKNYVYDGKGLNFSISSNNFIIKEQVQTTKQNMPESMHGSDMIQIRQEDDIAFVGDKKPIRTFLSIENNMYQIISEEMLNVFAGIAEFNNLVGDVTNKYAQEYKELNFLRQIFYEKIGNTPKLEKYLNLYKWLDSSLGQMLEQLIPASARYNKGLSTVIENTILQRDKYQHKLPIVKQKEIYPKSVLRGVEELRYNWTTSSAEERDQRDEVYNTIDLDNQEPAPILYDNQALISYTGSSFAIRKLSKTIIIESNKLENPSDSLIPLTLLNVLQTTSSIFEKRILLQTDSNTTIINPKKPNYSKNYEIIQASGRRENNKSFIASEGGDLEEYSPIPPAFLSGSRALDIQKIERAKTKSVLVNRFRSPGNIGEMLDPVSEEYSLYSTVNYRNLKTRDLYNISSSQTMSIDSSAPSLIKVNKNPFNVFKQTENSVYLDKKYDNINVVRQIPRSDKQYAWITSSAVLLPSASSFISDFSNITTYNTASFEIFSGSAATGQDTLRINY